MERISRTLRTLTSDTCYRQSQMEILIDRICYDLYDASYVSIKTVPYVRDCCISVGVSLWH
jgi:hypothetical protein